MNHSFIQHPLYIATSIACSSSSPSYSLLLLTSKISQIPNQTLSYILIHINNLSLIKKTSSFVVMAVDASYMNLLPSTHLLTNRYYYNFITLNLYYCLLKGFSVRFDWSLNLAESWRAPPYYVCFDITVFCQHYDDSTWFYKITMAHCNSVKFNAISYIKQNRGAAVAPSWRAPPFYVCSILRRICQNRDDRPPWFHRITMAYRDSIKSIVISDINFVLLSLILSNSPAIQSTNINLNVQIFFSDN
jgi:hypothetical protein